MKQLLTFLVFAIASTNVSAQSQDSAARACLQKYMSGDGVLVEQAFHPSATMKYIDVQTGEFKDVPIADYIARVKANTSRPNRTIEVVALDISGTAANAKIRIVSGAVTMYDYMNMLRINGEWKIVSKIFSRMQ